MTLDHSFHHHQGKPRKKNILVALLGLSQICHHIQSTIFYSRQTPICLVPLRSHFLGRGGVDTKGGCLVSQGGGTDIVATVKGTTWFEPRGWLMGWGACVRVCHAPGFPSRIESWMDSFTRCHRGPCYSRSRWACVLPGGNIIPCWCVYVNALFCLSQRGHAHYT